MKRLAVDMDGVLADTYSRLVKLHFDECSELLSIEDTTGKPEHIAFPYGKGHVVQQGFFHGLSVIQDSQEVMEELNKRYQLFVVSAAMEFPLSLSEKQQWLDIHFPFITWRQRVFCGTKDIIRADIMIDDYFKNLDAFEGETLLFTQPHNAIADCGRHKRVASWNEIKELLL